MVKGMARSKISPESLIASEAGMAYRGPEASLWAAIAGDDPPYFVADR